MIITQERKKVVQSHDFDSVNCTIDAEDMRYVASLLRNNYSNTRLAVVREVTANALDANLEANSDRQIEIKLPTKMNPTFAVRDFGGGLSQEDVFGLYSKYVSQPSAHQTITLAHLVSVSLLLFLMAKTSLVFLIMVE